MGSNPASRAKQEKSRCLANGFFYAQTVNNPPRRTRCNTGAERRGRRKIQKNGFDCCCQDGDYRCVGGSAFTLSLCHLRAKPAAYSSHPRAEPASCHRHPRTEPAASCRHPRTEPAASCRHPRTEPAACYRHSRVGGNPQPSRVGDLFTHAARVQRMH